jgi:hypothetical protein
VYLLICLPAVAPPTAGMLGVGGCIWRLVEGLVKEGLIFELALVLEFEKPNFAFDFSFCFRILYRVSSTSLSTGFSFTPE